MITNSVLWMLLVVLVSLLGGVAVQGRQTAAAHCSLSSSCDCTRAATFEDFSHISCQGPLSFNVLRGLPQLRAEKVEVVESNIHSLSDGAFGAASSYSLVLDRNHIVYLANDTFLKMKNTLRELSLNNNNLNEIPMNALAPLEFLRSLSLDGNYITSVLVNWGNLKESLTELKLSYNDLDSIPLNPENSLSNIKNLNTLHLSGNLLLSIEANGLPYSLKLLNASDNFIKTFPHDLFHVQVDLETLDLSENSIETLDENKYLTKLTLNYLNLSQNKLNIIRKSFKDTLKVNKINLSHNNISEIEKDAFSGLDCKGISLSANKLSKLHEDSFRGIESTLEDLDLSYNNFSKIPDALKDLKNLKVLNFSYNHLTKVKNSLYYFSGLKTLSLSGNSLGIFPVEALGPLRSLSSLDLSYNKIADIRKSDFKSWGKNLEKIYFQSNSLFFVGDNTFEYTPKLSELSLSYNSIGDMSLNAFKNLEKIEKFHISFSLKGYGFPTPLLSMKSLTFLAVDNNNVNSISKDITKLEKISTLILDFNRIKEIESSTFDSKAHKFLSDIRLSFNYINKIDSNTFSELNSLQSISLHDNKIMKISDYGFINLPECLYIYLSSNKIESIEKHAFSSLPKLRILDLHKNDLLSFDFNFFQNVTSENSPMTLNLSWNRISTIQVPDYTRAPVYVETLDLSHNRISKIPEKIVEIQTSLRVLDLGYNEITELVSENLYGMVALEKLNIVHNKIVTITDNAFLSLQKLLYFNLSHNHLEEISAGLFVKLENLVILDLSFNNIRSVSDSAFDNTKLQYLYLSNNKISSIAPTAFLNIGKYLRSLDLSHNQIDKFDSKLFQYASRIESLNLCSNNLTSENIHAFKNSSLLKIELCSNYLGSIPSEAFSSSLLLYELNLENTGLQAFPNLTLPHLVSLRLADNKISNISESNLSRLPKLKNLSLRNNQIPTLTGANWIQVPSLRNLDLSHNPIKVLDKPCFFGLYNLRELYIQQLDQIERMDAGIFMDLDKLTSLKIDFHRRVGLDFNQTLSHLKYLKKLSINVLEAKFVEDLPKELPHRLSSLEITGPTLKTIDKDSLRPLKAFHDFKLKIAGTSIVTFGKHFFSRFKGKNFEIDLSNNEIEKFGPEILYFTMGDIRRYGTKAFSGGIKLEGNKLQCGCDVKWFAEWLRRYLVETLGVNDQMSAGERLTLIESLKERLTCTDPKTRQTFPILTYDLSTDEKLCGLVLNVPKAPDPSSGHRLSPTILYFFLPLFYYLH